MKILYLECNMGAAGDMLTAALSELVPDSDAFFARLNAAGIPNVEVKHHTVMRAGVAASGVDVLIGGAVEGEPHHHEHPHEHHCEPPHEHNHNHAHEHPHEHHHHHASLDDMLAVINGLNVSDKVKADAAAVYTLIAEAESRAHARPVGEVHFHEVGAMDAVADIVGVCMLIEELAPDKIITSRVHVGRGTVKCAHGVMPVPAPATAYILTGVPIYSGAVEGELCTPTGAALLKYFTNEFSDTVSICPESIGYGAGKRRFFASDGTEILSAVRAVIGTDV